MSIRDYKVRYILTNGSTNETIKIPKIDYDEVVNADVTMNDLMLLRILKEELEHCEGVAITKSYMKD